MHSVRLQPLITYQDICQNIKSSVILVPFMIKTEYSNSASDLTTVVLTQVHASCFNADKMFSVFNFGIRDFFPCSHSSAVNGLKAVLCCQGLNIWNTHMGHQQRWFCFELQNQIVQYDQCPEFTAEKVMFDLLWDGARRSTMKACSV